MHFTTSCWIISEVDDFAHYRKQQKTRKVTEVMNDALLAVTEDSNERYMDVDLTEYSSSSRPAVPEPNSSSHEHHASQMPTEEQPLKVSAGQPVDSVDKVDLPEGV